MGKQDAGLTIIAICLPFLGKRFGWAKSRFLGRKRTQRTREFNHGCFKDTAHRLGLLDQWYRYRDAAAKEHVIAWAEANQVTLEDDTQNRKS
jgi:hypothetical protein